MTALLFLSHLGFPRNRSKISPVESGFSSDISGEPFYLRARLALCERRKDIICDAKIVTYLQDIAAVRGALLPHLSVRALIQIKGLAQAHALIAGRVMSRRRTFKK